MSIWIIFLIALKALARNKMRTALTMLGMIIGVSAVITMVALGAGAQSSIDAQIQSAGTNMVVEILRDELHFRAISRAGKTVDAGVIQRQARVGSAEQPSDHPTALALR